MKRKKDEYVTIDILDVLLDEKNTAPIYMQNSEGEWLEFDQIAVISFEDELYCILKPNFKVEWIKEDEAVVFKVAKGDGNERGYLEVEKNELVAIKVFELYYDLVEKENERKDNN